MKRKTLAQIAADNGLSRSTIQRWKKEGVDVHDPEALARHIADQAKPPPVASPEYSEHRARKVKLEADRLEMGIAMLKGDLLDKRAVEAREARIAHVCNAMLRASFAELPPLVAGLTAAKAERVIRDWSCGWAERLQDARDELWIEAKRAALAGLRGEARKLALKALEDSGAD